MMYRRILLLLLTVFVSSALVSQTCTNRGQMPATAFPVCGTATFSQSEVAPCGGTPLKVPGCWDGAGYADINPYWYKFTCFEAGDLGFMITPHTASDDYDWQLFDITGRDPDDVFTDSTLYVSSNWASPPGATGTTSSANSVTGCAGPDNSNKSKMPALIEGHEYLLLISHFTQDNQSGYDLVFNGGSANITDPKEPHFSHARAFCDGTEVILKFNKKMRCSTIAADGSDFVLSSSLATIIGASAPICQSGFDMDSMVIRLSNPLPPGTYSLSIKTGSDGNKVLDNCDRSVPDEEAINFRVVPVFPTPMDSLTKVGCAPHVLELVFSKPILCNSIAADGSDFRVTGSSAVTVSGAYGNCDAGASTSIIYVQLSAPIQTAGNFAITLQNGTDGNTIIDECEEQTPAGRSISFVTVDTVSANFSYNILFGCVLDTIQYQHPGGNAVNAWHWQFEDGSVSRLANPEKIYSIFGFKEATLIVSNGVCRDTATQQVNLDNELNADFESPEFICPEDTTFYKDKSIGKIVNWDWTFGNGAGSVFQAPPGQRYQPPHEDREYTIRLAIEDNIGCRDTVSRKVTVVTSCYIALPSAFTPNGDGLNDYLYPLNAYKAENLVFRVYNVYGQRVFESSDRFTRWDGTVNGTPQRAGNYVWMLEYRHKGTQRHFKLKGNTVLMR